MDVSFGSLGCNQYTSMSAFILQLTIHPVQPGPRPDGPRPPEHKARDAGCARMRILRISGDIPS